MFAITPQVHGQIRMLGQNSFDKIATDKIDTDKLACSDKLDGLKIKVVTLQHAEKILKISKVI